MSKFKILLKITGSIAAYKSAYLVSRLVQEGFEVKVVMSASATQFIGPLTFEGLTGNPVSTELFSNAQASTAMEHINLMRWADLIIAVPATAHFINRMASGIGDDLLTTLFLAHDFKKPYLVAPAMNTAMYLHPVTQKSLLLLKEMNVKILETASGVLACGETGWGKLLDPDLIYQEIKSALGEKSSGSTVMPTISTKKSTSILVTSGGTSEPIDGVRSITNFSSGDTGAKIVNYLSSLGFSVTHLRAKNSTKADGAFESIEFKTYSEFADILKQKIQSTPYIAVIQAAAVSDFHVDKSDTTSKMPSDEETILKLKANPKLLPKIKTWAITAKQPEPQVIAFKLTKNSSPEETIAAIKKTFSQSGVDYVFHNDLNSIENNLHAFKVFNSKFECNIQGSTKDQLASAMAHLISERTI